jgi:acetyltransferase-like isoleucine patch superfamily enzyme
MSCPLALAHGVGKAIGIALGLLLVSIPAALCRAEALVSGRDEVFLFWGQALALIPGLPGKYLRRCYYYLTLRSCSLSCDLGFLSYFSDRRTVVGRRVYVGFATCVGLATLDDGCMLGNRATIRGDDGSDHGRSGGCTPRIGRGRAGGIRVGKETWIGEGAIVMADVGSRCIISAGSVVSRPVPDGCLTGGSPARIVGGSIPAAPPAPAQEG